MLRLKGYRSKPCSFGELLNYAMMLDESILLNKDGSLTVGYTYSTSDLSSASLEHRNIIADRMNQVLNRFGTNWSLHVDSYRTKISEYPRIEESFFSSEITKKIDDNRRNFFENQGDLYETNFTCFLTYIPPSKIKAKLLELSTEKVENPFNKYLEHFKTKIDEFENIFKAFSDFRLTKLSNYEEEDEYHVTRTVSPILEIINFFITGKKHKVILPPMPMYLDSIIGAKNFVGGQEPKIGDYHIATITLDGFPSASYPNILNALTLMDFEYRFSSRFIYLDESTAIAMLDKERRKWNQQTTSVMQQLFGTEGRIDSHAVEMVAEVECAMADQKTGNVTFGYYIANIVLLDKNKDILKDKTDLVIQNIEALGFSSMVQNYNAIETWLGTFPSHSVQNIRKQMISSLNFSHFIPLSNIWTGNPISPCDKYPLNSPPLLHALSDGNIPYRLNLHVKDVGHTLIFGPTGSGKSTLLALLIAQFDRYPNSKSWVFDKSRSIFALTKGMGGAHYDLISDDSSAVKFAPLSNINSKSKRIWVEDWLEIVCKLQGIDFTAIHSRKIKEALDVHVETGATTLTEFVALIQDYELSNALAYYTVQGNIDILDGSEDVISNSNISTFELDDLMSLGDKIALPVLLYMFYIIEESLDGSPTGIWIDESWTVLGHPVFSPKIKKWLKELRKKNCFVVMGTQSLSDAVSSGILDVLQESCPVKIFLPNPEAYKEGTNGIMGPYEFYRAFGLNDQQVQIIYKAIPKREYYYTSVEGNRKFDLVFDDYTLCWCASADVEYVNYIKKLIEKDKENWIDNWIDYRLNK